MRALPKLARALAAGVLTLGLAVASPGLAPAATEGANGKPVSNRAGTTFGILSHRGGAGEAPENSVEAFTKSAEAGFDSIETDIVFTSDNQAVMSHYDILPLRCTETGRSIHTMTLAEVALVRCENLVGEKVVPIPTFEQLAEILAAHPGVGLTLDIKSYPGQRAAEKSTWASRAIQLVRNHGLVSRTAITSFYWKQALPVIRKYAPKIYVLALNLGTVNLDLVRLARKLGANGFGIKMKYTSASLVSYVKAKHMDSVPWEVTTPEQRLFCIATGGKLQLFSTDTPTTARDTLISGGIDLDPVLTPAVTLLPAPVNVSNQKYKANKRQYPVVLGKAMPATEVSQLQDVTLAVTVTGGKGKGSLYVGASSSPLSSSKKVRLPKGTRTLTISAPLGDGGKLRIYATRTVTLTVDVVAYTRLRAA
jgi:glycerophosphoryl diester phosphodiesterase